MQTVVRKLFPSCDAMTNMASFPVRKVIYCMVKRACTCTTKPPLRHRRLFLAQRAGSPRIATHDHNYPFNYATVADFKWSGTRNSSLDAHSETSCSLKPDLLVRSHREWRVILSGICYISELFNAPLHPGKYCNEFEYYNRLLNFVQIEKLSFFCVNWYDNIFVM